MWKIKAEKKANDFIKKNLTNTKDYKPETKKKLMNEKNLKHKKLTIDELANFCKRKGFVFKSSEIYGGFAGFWDFGPLGVELFQNIKNEWWNFFHYLNQIEKKS